MTRLGSTQFMKVFVLTFCISYCRSLRNDVYRHFLVHLRAQNIPFTEGSIDFNRTFYNFKENLKIQHLLNSEQPTPSAKYGVTKFSHLSQEEFKELYLSDMLWQPFSKPVNQSGITSIQKLKQMNVPQKLDWRNQLNFSIISTVKNQKKCGGCWAFSTVETVESMYAKKTMLPPPDLSVQQVIDCSTNNDGCAGGDTCNALMWMVNTHTALVSDARYPLTDTSDSCKVQPPGTPGIQTKSYTCQHNLGDESQTVNQLQNGPVVATVEATTWANYQGGIIQYHCGTSVNHAVQIVGYDLTGEVPFYIVRNSWGVDFGHDGYLYIKIGDNVCGIASKISTVEV